MYSFPVNLISFFVAINVFGDVIINVINGYICPNANATVHIQSTMIPSWRSPELDRSSCPTCDEIYYPSVLDTNQFSFYPKTDPEITRIERILIVHRKFIMLNVCRSADIGSYYVVNHMKLGLRMTSDHSVTDQVTGINVPWTWNASSGFPDSPPMGMLHINIDQKANIPYYVKFNLSSNCISNLTYNITIEHDCSPRKETTFTETAGTKSHSTTTRMPKANANNRRIGKSTKKKIDPRLINSLAVSGSAVVIATVVSLVMYFGWYKRKLNQLGMLPQNATPARS